MLEKKLPTHFRTNTNVFILKSSGIKLKKLLTKFYLVPIKINTPVYHYIRYILYEHKVFGSFRFEPCEMTITAACQNA